jgi:septation ring formation regulator EzrA
MSERIHLEIEASHAPMLLPIFRQQRIEMQNSVDELQQRLSAAMAALEELQHQFSISTETMNMLDRTISVLSENAPVQELSESYSHN